VLDVLFEELDALFESSTIKPTFERVHVILALLIFNENPKGIGRYRLRKELLIGSGTTRSLVTKLNEILGFITVPNENNRKGHILTQNGKNFLNHFKKKIPLLKKGDDQILKELTINRGNIKTYYCLVKSAANQIESGILQRDAAIKVNGIGATCLIYNGISLIFPPTDEESIKVNQQIFNYFKKEITDSESTLEKNDVIIVGLGDSEEKARLTALNAALTLV
jgi:predicted transcriptional regulator